MGKKRSDIDEELDSIDFSEVDVSDNGVFTISIKSVEESIENDSELIEQVRNLEAG